MRRVIQAVGALGSNSQVKENWKVFGEVDIEREVDRSFRVGKLVTRMVKANPGTDSTLERPPACGQGTCAGLSFASVCWHRCDATVSSSKVCIWSQEQVRVETK